MYLRLHLAWLWFFLLAALVPQGAARVESVPPMVVATTGMVADLVRAVAGPEVTVLQLLPPGVDPHLYKPTAADAAQLARAAAIFYNGLRLEGRMGELFDRLERGGRVLVGLGYSLSRERLLEVTPGVYDPHIWFDVKLWSETIPAIVEGLAKVCPAAAEDFRHRGEVVKRQLEELDETLRRMAYELPPERRILVTSHDAYGYFGRAYGFQVIGLQGISTVSEAGLGEVTALVDLLRERGIPAIFVETSVNPETLQRVAEQAGVRIGGELFSDALGQPEEVREGFAVGTYEGMMRYNLQVLLRELGSTTP